MLQLIENSQTKDCHYPIYFLEKDNVMGCKGYYFLDEELKAWARWPEDYFDLGYYGPYFTLDDVCKAQCRHWRSTQSL